MRLYLEYGKSELREGIDSMLAIEEIEKVQAI